MASRKIAADILEDAIEYVRNGWTKYSLARNHDGFPVACTDDTAAFFCIDGAISRAAWERRDWVNDIIAIKTIEEMEKCRINVLNDELIRTVEDAVRVMEKCVETLRRPPGRSGRAPGRKKRRPASRRP